MLAELRRIAALLLPGEPLTNAAYDRHFPRVAHTTVGRRFGGWREALEKAGLGNLYSSRPISQKMRTPPARGWSEADLIAELRRAHSLVDKQWLTATDFDAHWLRSTFAIRRRFSSFRKALEAAGIPNSPHSVIHFSERRCFERLAEVWAYYGRTQKFRKLYESPSKFKKKHMFSIGHVRNTLIVFCRIG